MTMTRHDSILDTGYGNDMKGWSRLSPRTALRWFVDLIRPAIFTRSGPKKSLRRTAYLDGLRGFAAFLVYWHHHQLWPRTQNFADQNFENGYGYKERYYFACLPIVRTFFTGGHFAVSVFFVISGYVLSTKSLSLIHSGDYDKLSGAVGSALFRRWLRLHLPVIGTTFVYMTIWHVFGIWTVNPKHKHTWVEEFWNWFQETKHFSFIFRSSGDPWTTYNYHAWSIPVEFRGSVVVYTTALAFSRCRRNARLMGYLALMFYFMYIVDGWFATMFLSGMLLCDLDILARNNNLPKFISNLEPHKKLIFNTLFVCAAFLSGVPSHIADVEIIQNAPGWRWVAFMKPAALWDFKWFYLLFASTFLIASAPRIAWLKRFCDTTFCQYLGKISYALYLVHGPVLWTLGDRLYAATGWYRETNLINTPNWVDVFPLSKDGPLGLDMAFLVPQIILLPFTLWLAEIVTKLFDEPSVTFSQWLYDSTLESSGTEK